MRVATFNLRDFFFDDSHSNSDWLKARAHFLAAQVHSANIDVLLIQEIGGAEATAILCSALGPDFQSVTAPADERGIGCAIASRLPILASCIHTSSALPFPSLEFGTPAAYGTALALRRPFPEVTVDAGALGHVSAVSVHLKSNLPRRLKARDGSDVPTVSGFERGEAVVRADVLRNAEALFLRQIVDTALLGCADAKLVVGGDFNADAHATVHRIIADERGAAPLCSVQASVPEHRRFSMRYQGRGKLIDHLLVSPALAPRLGKADILNDTLPDSSHLTPQQQQDAPPLLESDHAMLWAEFLSV
jgi:hypothetical protein